MKADILLFVAVWRVVWYFVLILHSFKYGRWVDMLTAVILMLLSFVLTPASKPMITLSAFVVAPLITYTLIRYQKEYNQRSYGRNR